MGIRGSVWHSVRLPPSTLIKRRAKRTQVAHALGRLAFLYLRRNPGALGRVLDDDGFLHMWLHFLHTGTVGGWPFKRADQLVFAASLRGYERAVGWTEESCP